MRGIERADGWATGPGRISLRMKHSHAAGGAWCDGPGDEAVTLAVDHDLQAAFGGGTGAHARQDTRAVGVSGSFDPAAARPSSRRAPAGIPPSPGGPGRSCARL